MNYFLRFFLDDHRFLVEPACGAALAAVYEPGMLHDIFPASDQSIVVIICGGSTVTLDLIRQWDEMC